MIITKLNKFSSGKIDQATCLILLLNNIKLFHFLFQEKTNQATFSVILLYNINYFSGKDKPGHMFSCVCLHSGRKEDRSRNLQKFKDLQVRY